MTIRSLVIMAVALGATAHPHGALAQVGPGMPPMPGFNLPTDPKMLPGDWVLPPGFHFPPPPPGMKPPPMGSTAPAPSLKLALKAAQAALDACKKAGFDIGVAVIDSVGQPRIGLSEDGTSGGHIYTAVRKGLVAIAFEMPSSAVAAKLQADPAAAHQVTPNMATMAGAVPLFDHGKLIGAIGASGATSDQDEKCAAAGAAKIAMALR